ncbi:MAG TPA: glycosyltransferase family 39 protein, partial [Ktedonobacterales bacterium]
MTTTETPGMRAHSRWPQWLARVAPLARPAQAARRLPPGRRDVAALVALGILARGLTAALLRHPGYLDAAYYYAVARNVAQGRGLTEDFIITYLTPAAQVTHPSNLWWMPGASLLLAPFFWLLGAHWWVAELPNVLLTGTLPALGYWLGRDLLGTRRAALGAGLLTLVSGFYYPLYDPLPDNFGLYAWAAGGALLLLAQGARGRHGRTGRFALAGLCCGVAHLARAEAPLLLAIGAGIWLWTRRAPSRSIGDAAARDGTLVALPLWSLAAFAGGYLVVMAPWFARNLALVGTPLPPGGLQAAWLRDYNDFFSYQKPLTPATYFAWGIGPILGSKLAALVETARQMAAVMSFALAPFALVGLWRLRRQVAAWPWLLYTVGAWLALALLFPFPAIYGSVLHSEVAVFPFLNVAAVAGLDGALEWIGRRTGAGARRTAERQRVYLGASIALAALLSAFLVLSNAHAWDATANAYASAGRVVVADADLTPRPPSLRGKGERAHTAPIVMVADPANYYVDT